LQAAGREVSTSEILANTSINDHGVLHYRYTKLEEAGIINRHVTESRSSEVWLTPYGKEYAQLDEWTTYDAKARIDRHKDMVAALGEELQEAKEPRDRLEKQNDRQWRIINDMKTRIVELGERVGDLEE
jgi:predicted MarR family transcription regulator